ncbi:MAG: hypothetical protein PHO91_01865 [Patescibacteria group bacterium]|nr:hypothetical protein [Patescibacteria group bacterium]
MQTIGEIFKNKPKNKKAPAYQWQDFALKIIEELSVPAFKRSAVFKICKEKEKHFVEKCLDETKELAQGEKWKYFFKLAGQNQDTRKFSTK